MTKGIFAPRALCWNKSKINLKGDLRPASNGVARSQTQLRDFTFTFHFHALEKEMATPLQCSCLEIPWTEEPGKLQSMGSLRVGHN